MEETSKTPNFFQRVFNKKLLIQKGIIAAIALVLVLVMSLSFYFWLHNVPEGTQIGKNSFWYIEIVWNPGIGFSGLSGKTGLIYFIQSLMFIVLLAVYLLLSHDKITGSFVALAMFGGLFNLIQRAASGNAMVLDYFKFGFMDFAVFNWPDMFVVIGIFGFIISYIVITIIGAVRENRAEKIAKYKKENNEQQQ